MNPWCKAVCAIRRLIGVAVLAAFLLDLPSSANALCDYHNELYAKTTVDQEFQDSSLVVRGIVLSSKDLTIADTDDGYGVFYRVKIDQVFKGVAQAEITYFSYHNSGGFYLDVGTEYILFLNPIDDTDWEKVVPGAFMINYNCGRSQEWVNVSINDRKHLSALAVQAKK